MNILQRIFTNYYEEIKYTLHPRDTEMENNWHRDNKYIEETLPSIFIGYWNNRRICSTNEGLPPMVKRQRYYESLDAFA